MNFRNVFSLGLLLLCVVGPIDAASAEVTAVAARPAHPVLLRNDHGPLLRVVIDVADEKPVRLKSIRFSLVDSDDSTDVAELSLYSTGASDVFSPATSVGERVASSAVVDILANRNLKSGRNVYWLSAKLNPKADLSHRVAAKCITIETSTGSLTPKDLTPGLRQRIGVALLKAREDGVHTYRIPALTTSSKGTLLCVYDMRRRASRDLQEDIDIGLSESFDGGATWKPQRVIMNMGTFGGKPEAENGCSDPGIIVDRQTGEIFVFAVWMHGNVGKHQWRGDGSAPGYEIGKAAQMMMVRSSDDGKTWMKPENLTRTLKKEAWWLLAPAPQSGINLPDGTLVMPIQGRDENGVPFATIMHSRDHGRTWTVGAPATSHGNECQAARLGDGSIMLNIRNDQDRFRAVYVTKDLGKTWHSHETNRKALIEPNCNGSLLRFDYVEGGEKKHVLLFSNPHTQKGRTHQTLQASFDDGRNWPASHHLLLDEGRGAGYPSLTQIDEKHIGIVYEGSQAHLVFERIPVTEILDPASRAKRRRP